MRESARRREEDVPDTAPLVPAPDDIQEGYELDFDAVKVGEETVKVFRFRDSPTELDETVLCLPGLGASGRSFAPLRPWSRQWRWRMWTPPNHTPFGTAPADHNVGLLRDAFDVPDLLPKRVALVGSSYGSLLALRFALEHPERVWALVLVSPVASTRKIRHGAVFASSMLRVPLPFAYVFAPAVARALGGRKLPSEGRAELVRESRRIDASEMVRRLRDIIGTDLLERLPELKMPTLIVHGSRDIVVPLSSGRDVHRRIPGAELEVIRGAGHLPYMSHPEQFGRRLHHFLTHHHPGAVSDRSPVFSSQSVLP